MTFLESLFEWADPVDTGSDVGFKYVSVGIAGVIDPTSAPDPSWVNSPFREPVGSCGEFRMMKGVTQQGDALVNRRRIGMQFSDRRDGTRDYWNLAIYPDGQIGIEQFTWQPNKWVSATDEKWFTASGGEFCTFVFTDGHGPHLFSMAFQRREIGGL